MRLKKRVASPESLPIHLNCYEIIERILYPCRGGPVRLTTCFTDLTELISELSEKSPYF